MIAIVLIPLLLVSAVPQGTAPTKRVRHRAPAVHATENSQAARPDRVVYRKDEKFAVWDSRGLTIRTAQKVHSTHLSDISLTPKLFTNDQIAETKRLIDDGARQKGASALSGSRRVGDVIYFLPRWDDKDGKPWLEALVKVDLSEADPGPELLGRFEAMSLAHTKVDDKLVLLGGLPSVVGRREKDWGVASFEPASRKFSFNLEGTDLVTYWTVNQRQVLAEEKTSYNSRTLVRVDMVSGDRRTLAESNSGFVLLSASEPLIVRLETPEGEVLRNLDTGSQLRIAKDAQARVTPQGVLVWRAATPDQQVLYNPQRWSKISKGT